MRGNSITSKTWLVVLSALAVGLTALVLILAKSALSQTEQAARDKAVTLVRTLGYAITGVVRQSPDQEGRVAAMLEEISKDPEVVSVGILRPDGVPVLEQGKSKLPKLPQLSNKEYLIDRDGYLIVVVSFEIRRGCSSAAGSCGCAPGQCTCQNHDHWELQPGRYGLAMIVNPKGRQGVRFAIIAVSVLSLAVLIGLLATARLLGRSIEAKAQLAKNVALEQQRRMSLESLNLVAAGLAHEIRNPLGAIAGYAQLLDEQATDPLSKDRIRLMLKELERIGERVEEFLSFARKRNLRLAEVDLRSVVQDSVALMSADAGRQGCVLEAQLPKHPLAVNGDAQELRELVANLILNSIQACKDGGRVGIELSKDNSGIILKVVDNGSGIAQGDLERIFEPYFTTKPKGSGLGLAISRRIAEDHGAILTLENNPGRGAKATLVFLSTEVQ